MHGSKTVVMGGIIFLLAVMSFLAFSISFKSCKVTPDGEKNIVASLLSGRLDVLNTMMTITIDEENIDKYNKSKNIYISTGLDRH